MTAPASADAPSARAPLLLIHGLSASTRWWRHTVAALGADRAVLAVDLSGFGARRRGRFRLAAAAAEVGEVIARRDDVPVDVIGHSMGGLVAAQLASGRPELVRRLVLVSAPLVPFAWGLRRHVWNLARAVPTLVPRFVPVLAVDAARAGPVTLASAARQLLRADVSPELDRIRAPALLVWGGRDPLVPVEVGRQIAGRIPQSLFVELPRAGHVPMWERPTEFNAVVRAFLDGTDEDGR